MQVPLTWDSVARSMRERTQSTVFYRVSVNDEEVVCETKTITLAPMEEWRERNEARGGEVGTTTVT